MMISLISGVVFKKNSVWLYKLSSIVSMDPQTLLSVKKNIHQLHWYWSHKDNNFLKIDQEHGRNRSIFQTYEDYKADKRGIK